MKTLTLGFDDSVDTGSPATENALSGRACGHCQTDISALKPNAKFCSQKCRNAAHQNKLRKQKLSGTKPEPPVEEVVVEETPSYHTEYDADLDNDDDGTDKPDKNGSQTVLKGSLRGLDVQSQYIITHQRDMINDLKNARERLRNKLEKVTTERNDFSKKLDRIELERDLKVAEKSGLNGLSQNPVVNKLIDHFGPVLAGALGDKLKGNGMPALEGVNTEDPELMEQIQVMTTWYGKLPKEQQTMVYSMLDALADACKDATPEKLSAKFKQINNILNGTQNGNTTNFYRAGIGY